MPARLKLVGKVFGRLTIIEDLGTKDGRSMWLAVCSCESVQVIVNSNSIKQGRKSCGCLQKESVIKHNQDRVTHRMVGTLTHNSWHSMMLRCFNKNDKDYERYKLRAPDNRWRVFENFLADMGLRPGLGYSLERKDNNLPYSKENCIWATTKEQARNTSTNRVLSFNGKSQCLSAWSEEIGIRHDTLSQRLEAGWSVERTLTTKLRGTK